MASVLFLACLGALVRDFSDEEGRSVGSEEAVRAVVSMCILE